MTANDGLQGDKALLAQTPEVEIAGKTYRMRRLDYSDCARLARILTVGKQQAKLEMLPVLASGNPLAQTEAFVSVLMAAFGFADLETLGFLASVLGVQLGEIKDPDLFPISSLPAVFRAIGEHTDLQAFFVQVQQITMPGNETSTPDSSEQSTS